MTSPALVQLPSSPTPVVVAPRTPLLPVAVALTAGLLLDRWAQLPITASILALAICFGVWLLAAHREQRSSIIWLWGVVFVLGALWHQIARLPAPEDICHYAPTDGRVVRVRGIVLTVPAVIKLPDVALRTVPQAHRSSFLLQVKELDLAPWSSASGKLKVWVEERVEKVRLGDELEIVGLLLPWSSPGNPGETSLVERGQDQGVFTGMIVKTVDGITVRAHGSPWRRDTWLQLLHSSATDTLERHLPSELAGVGRALVLGDVAALEQPQMEGYMRTGVFHVLAVSGQHLVVLCIGLEFVLTCFGVRRRPRAVSLALFVIGYSLLTGGQPPVVRAAVMVVTACGGMILLRKPQPLNSLLLAWIVLAMLNPGDLFQTGCQLSFLAVLFLQQVGPWKTRTEENLHPLDRLERELASGWKKLRYHIQAWLYWCWVASLVIWLLCLPLLASRFHMVTPIAVLLGPFLVLLAAVALIAGFLLVLVGLVFDPIAFLPAWVMETCLAAAKWLIDLAQQVPGAYWYCADVPAWWVAGFYLHVVTVLLWPKLWQWWKWHLLVGGVWFILLFLSARSPHTGEFRCTILAVGHGSCAVLETPDGRVFLCDTGSMAGPEAATRYIAPYLWNRGYTRIDEVFLSHADLDHFNGLPALLQRFPIAQVSLTPTFRDKRIQGVSVVARELERRKIPVRVLAAPQTLVAGPESYPGQQRTQPRVLAAPQKLVAGAVEMEVLHPPLEGLENANENARSMVLLIRYEGRTLLLTGDLEGEGLRQVLRQPLPPLDVLVAPHHGSPSSNTAAFAQWASAKLVISSEGIPHFFRPPDPYSSQGAVLWRTWKEGAVTVRISKQGVVAATYRTKRRWEVRQ